MTKLKAFVSEKASEELFSFLKAEGCEIVEISAKADVHEAIACHPDIYYCMLPKGLYEGDPSLLSKEYPGDVSYNAAAVGRYFICSRYTAWELKEEAVRQGLVPIVVPQGYVKCNLVVLDGNHVITEDEGIAKVLAEIDDIECLLVPPGEVRLPGFRNGFLGGACGTVGRKVIFNGDLAAHSCFLKIARFCSSCGMEPVWIPSYPLTDIGSIFFVD
jgi:hypothetical protein